MVIQENTNTLILRYAKYEDKILIDELNKDILDLGYCWMYKAGRKISSEKLKAIIESSKFIILKAPKSEGGKYFLATIDAYYEGKPTEEMRFPEYYQTMDDYIYDFSLDGTWIRIKQIVEISENYINDFYVESSGNNARDIISKTRTSVLYVRCEKSMIIKEK